MVTEALQYPPTKLPILLEGDLLVVGGSFGGIACAQAAARAGLRVILVESQTFLGHEVTSTLRPWFELSEETKTNALPELISGALQAAGTAGQAGGIVPLKMGPLKIFLEDWLFSAGVKILYSSLPVDLIFQAGKLVGVVIGNKSGRQAIVAPVVVDATPTSLLARLAGMKIRLADDELSLYHRTLEFDRLKGVPPARISVPEELGIAGDEVRFIPGSRGEEHGFVVCPLLLAQNIQDVAGWTHREIQARQITMKLAAHLLRNVHAFHGATLAGSSYQLYGPPAGSIDGAGGLWIGEGGDVPLALVDGSHTISAPDLAGEIPGLFILGTGMLAGKYQQGFISSPIGAARAGQALGDWIARNFSSLARGPISQDANAEFAISHIRSHPQASSKIILTEFSQPQSGRKYRSISTNLETIPVIREVEVLVVGGGTSGASAAAISGREGARTLLVEFNPGLGGTGTFGGVHSYWFGRRTGYAQEVIRAVDAKHAELGIAPPKGALLKWNIEAKMEALLRRLEENGVEILWDCLVIGTLVEDDRVCGTILATPYGPAAIKSEVIVDATGDGDVAVFAGADYVYGADRDHITMWYSLAQYYRPGVTNNNFTSMVDVGNVEDYTRAIFAGRRRGEEYDSGTYIAPRESRHILADVVLTLNDQLLKRCWRDCVYVAFSNHDVKGHTSSDWLRAGLIPPNLEIEIPYRALLPRGLEGILITGKAISATHDAQPAIRMQPDMENLGGVAGLAAAMAVQKSCLPRQLEYRELQSKLVKDRVLDHSILTRKLQPFRADPQMLTRLLVRLDPSMPLYAYQDMDLDVPFEGDIPIVALCCAGPQAVPFLESALMDRSGASRLMIARALALVGSQAGVPDLIQAIHAETPDEGFQYRTSHIRHVNLPPDQGAAPDVVFLLYALGMTRDSRALPVWEHFAELVADAGDNDLRDRHLGLFYYVDSICYGAERLGDRRAIPLLKRMHSNPLFQNRLSTQGFEKDFFLERQAYLEMVIARALAHCGDESGFATLIDYLEDSRALLAEHAHSELIRITGEDFPKDQFAWRSWLVRNKDSLQPRPLQELNEPLEAWGQEILLCSEK